MGKFAYLGKFVLYAEGVGFRSARTLSNHPDPQLKKPLGFLRRFAPIFLYGVIWGSHPTFLK